MSDDKPRKSRSDAELVQTSENHLKYEVDMLAALTEAIPKLGPEEDESFTTWGIRHALLESFAVHARTLLGFLYSSSPWEDDVIAEDFFDDPETWRKARPDKSAVLSRIPRRVGKEIVHLTYARSRVTEAVKKWPILEIYALGNDHYFRRNIGQFLGNLLSHRLLKYHHAVGLDQHLSDDLGSFRVEEIVIPVGPSDSHDQRDFQDLT